MPVRVVAVAPGSEPVKIYSFAGVENRGKFPPQVLLENRIKCFVRRLRLPWLETRIGPSDNVVVSCQQTTVHCVNDSHNTFYYPHTRRKYIHGPPRLIDTAVRRRTTVETTIAKRERRGYVVLSHGSIVRVRLISASRAFVVSVHVTATIRQNVFYSYVLTS